MENLARKGAAAFAGQESRIDERLYLDRLNLESINVIKMRFDGFLRKLSQMGVAIFVTALLALVACSEAVSVLIIGSSLSSGLSEPLKTLGQAGGKTLSVRDAIAGGASFRLHCDEMCVELVLNSIFFFANLASFELLLWEVMGLAADQCLLVKMERSG